MVDSISLSPEEFKRFLNSGEIDFIFDLRNTDEFENWKIEGPRAIETLNIPQPDFIGEEEQYQDRFPKNKRIITICAHGDSSRYTAKWLQERGYYAQSLEGGMDAWSEFYQTVRVCDKPVIYQINRVARGCLGYIIAANGEAVVIDAARHLENFTSILEQDDLRLRHVFDTHIHADHISGGRMLSELTGAEYYINSADTDGAAYKITPMKDDDGIFKLGEHSLKVIDSPGHTPGSTSFLLDEKILFTGDTIMKSAIGRPDLGGKADAWSLMLYNTLFERYAALDDGVLIFPSHAVPLFDEDESGAVCTTLGNSRRNLDLFRLPDKEKFKDLVKNSLPINPERYQDIRKVNLGLLNAAEDRMKELEIGKNLCGMAKADL